MIALVKLSPNHMKLTDEQTQALWEDSNPRLGLRTVSARAGTGKTTVLTDYCIDIAEKWHSIFMPWQGMALLSYTNVAKDELLAKLRKSYGNTSLVNSPHSIETIDSFLNQHVFLPHGGKTIGYPQGRPKLVGEPFGIFKAKDRTAINQYGGVSRLDYAFIFDKTYYGKDGRIYPNFGTLKKGDDGVVNTLV